MTIQIDAIRGTHHGRLTVVAGSSPHPGNGRRRVFCKCECGQYMRVLLDSLRRRQTQSCGCLRDERAAEMGRNRRRTVAPLLDDESEM